MPADPHNHWPTIGIIAFLGGIVSNIIMPKRRGAMGFISAAIVGIFSGGVAGVAANYFELHLGMQVLITAAFAVMGDRILTAILITRQEKLQNITNVTIEGGNNQNQFGDGDQNQG